MRRFLLAAMVFGTAAGAHAADMPDYLRGSLGEPAPTRNWDGWYAGGQATYSSSGTDFSQSVVGLTNFIFRDSVLQQPTSTWSLLNKTNGQASGFGAFVGRNYQWDDLVFGIEANYNYLVDLATSTSGSNSLLITNPPGDTPPPGVTDVYGVTLTGKAAAQIKDVITFRGRAGWATGNFSPYIFGGVAVGRMDISRSVTSAVTKQQDTTTTDAFGVTTRTRSRRSCSPANPATTSWSRPPIFSRARSRPVFFPSSTRRSCPIWSMPWPEISDRLARYDPDNQYAVNYMWGTTGIGYNVKAARQIAGRRCLRCRIAR